MNLFDTNLPVSTCNTFVTSKKVPPTLFSIHKFFRDCCVIATPQKNINKQVNPNYNP